MTSKKRAKGTLTELVDQYVAISLAQFDAIRDDNSTKFNSLIDGLKAIEDELRGREADERAVLKSLYTHDNPQVRLNAATATLAVDPRQARAVLEQIRATQEQPQALDAGMTLWNLDRGVFKPT
jgi:hypothetical protein